MRHIFTFVNQLHTVLAPLTIPLGAMYGLNKASYKLDKEITKIDKERGTFASLLESGVLCLPEGVVGGVSGYFIVYTLPPYSLYKRYQLMQNTSK